MDELNITSTPHTPATPVAVQQGIPVLEVSASKATATRSLFPAERVLFAVVLVAATLIRLIGAGQLEPNVSTAETVQLAAVEALISGNSGSGSSLFGWAGLGASGLALVPAAALRVLRPEPELALRLYAGLGSIAFVALFYVLCRQRFAPVVSLTATALLAFSPWSIYFGRNGELNAIAASWAIVAILALQRALRGGGPQHWLAAGAASTAGLYWHPSAIWLLPALTVPIILTAVADRRARSRLTVALCVFVAAGLLVAAPRVSALLSHPISTPAMLTAEGAPPDAPVSLRNRAQAAVRAFIFLDPGVTPDTRYQPTATAPLDSLTGILLLAGIGLAAWKMPSGALPLAAFLVPLVGSQLISPRVPTLGDALVALPALYLLVGESLDRLVLVLPFPSVTRAVLLAAIPAYALFGWQAYAGWIGSAASAQARQPALDYDELDAWIGEQREAMQARQPAPSAKQWRDDHPRLATGSRVVRRPREARSNVSPNVMSQMGLRAVGEARGEGGDRAGRGVAAGPNGEVYVSDQNGRVSRLDPDRQVLTPLPQQGPRLEHVSDIAADKDGFLYLADAERSLLVKLAPTGQILSTFGAEWGMYRPRGIAIGPDGRLYVADTGRNRVVIGETSGKLVKSIVPPSSFGAFEQPTEVAVDASGRIYVGLPEIGRLAILDESGQLLGGWSIPKGNTIESSRIAVVADGAIAMSDPAQGKVRLLDADGRELAVADAPGRPYGVATADGRVFVADTAGGRLLQFTLGQ